MKAKKTAFIAQPQDDYAQKWYEKKKRHARRILRKVGGGGGLKTGWRKGSGRADVSVEVGIEPNSNKGLALTSAILRKIFRHNH